MPVSLTIDFDDLDQLQAFCQAQKQKLPANDPAPAAEPKKGPGRPKKAEAPKEPVQTDIEEVTSAPVEAPSHDEMVHALTKLNQKHGIAAVREVLGEFGYQRVSEPKEAERAAVIQKAEAKLAA